MSCEHGIYHCRHGTGQGVGIVSRRHSKLIHWYTAEWLSRRLQTGSCDVLKAASDNTCSEHHTKFVMKFVQSIKLGWLVLGQFSIQEQVFRCSCLLQFLCTEQAFIHKISSRWFLPNYHKCVYKICIIIQTYLNIGLE